MKTILRIVVILLVAGIVSSGIYALAGGTSLTSSNEAGFGQPPAMTGADGQSVPQMREHDGGEGGASIAGGLGGVLVTLAKLTGITLVVLFAQKVFNKFNMPKLVTVKQ
jgi:hypothetical protein